MGHLAAAPELRYLPGGQTGVVDLAIAVNERYKKDDEVIESVSFVDCVFFGRTAEVVNEYLKKGSPILVEGRLRQDRWEKDGQKRSKLKVIVEQMKMIGGKPTESQSENAAEEELVGSGASSSDDSF